MLLKKNVLVCALLVTQLLVGQETPVKNLKEKLATATDQEKISIYFDLYQSNIPLDEALEYIQKGIALAKRKKLDSLHSLYFFAAQGNYYKTEFKTGKKYATLSLNIAPHDEFKARCYNLLGAFCEALSQEDSAFYYYDEALEKIANDTSKKALAIKAIVKNNQANFYFKKGKFHLAIKDYLDSNKISSSLGDADNEFNALNNLGTCFKELEEYEEAKFYFEKALRVNISEDRNILKNVVEIGLGDTEVKMGNYDRGIKLLLNAEKKLEGSSYEIYLSVAYQALSEAYLIDNTEKALHYSKKTISKIKEINNPYVAAGIYTTNGLLHFKKKDYHNALASLMKAKEIARENEHNDLLYEIFLAEYEIYKIQKKATLALQHYEVAMAYKDTLFSIEKNKQITDANTRYKTKQKENQILQLKQKEAQQKLVLEKERTTKVVFAVATITALLLLAGIYYFNQQQKKQDARETALREKQMAQETQLQVTFAREKEKDKIALTLHGQHAKDLELIAAGLQNNNQPIWAEKISQIKDKIKDLAYKVQSVPFSESPFKDQVLNLAADDRLARTQVTFTGLKDIDWKQIAEPIKRNLLFAIKENISNIYNHSQATRVDFNFEKKDGVLFVSMKDNGKGFSTEDVKKGIGLRDIKLKMDEINGDVTIESQSEKGTKILFNIILT
ncbi:tetratricopeptide repeat-containing sensor histidine kinase [Marinirhabdus gelatinilytica]|uniref:histidine kinase n=1 Tax=Marinirhabdus gelatinilytica TaxID=1703343 RepID=A0A370Q642_9FLAO|nr:tetratricopeptide repeat-containing sensor histidine kinase [Marinirhabdus gelatinilytica]RDK83832.1 signal transduction histidine kinase [Marinirhabdus gelatinilytica]